MKIIHTSDWHLGQSFYGKSRASEHKQFLTWLIEQVKSQLVDAIIVAGDIFDTSTPPSYARELYNQFVVDLLPTRCQLVILGGNHDSVATLNESKQLFSYLNTHLIAAATPDSLNTQLLTLNKVHDNGQLKSLLQLGAIVCAIPFIRPRDVMQSQAGQSATEKTQQLQQAITEHYQALYQLAYQQQQQIHEQHGYLVPIIMTGHLTTVGAKTSESVRDIYIGTLDALPANALPAADYIALGHIHRSQRVAKTEHIRYSGSPIALSFDELKQAKSVNLVEFEQGKLSTVTELEVPEFQPMQSISGDMATISARLDEFDFVDETDNEQHTWLDIEIQDDDYLTDIQSRLAQTVADKPVDILTLRRARKRQQSAIEQTAQETLAELTSQDVFERRLALEVFDGDDGQARMARLRQRYQEAQQQVLTPESDTVESTADHSQSQTEQKSQDEGATL